jgi:branched-chain amino acid transport system permease protein
MGLSLIFGLLTVVNFAHGAFYMWGAYVALLSAGYFNNFWLGLIVVPLVTGAMGMAVEYLFVRRLYGLNPDYPLLLTFGLSLIMMEAVRILFGTTGYPFNAPVSLQQSINFFNLFSFPLYRIFVIFVTAAVIIFIWLFWRRPTWINHPGGTDSEMVRVWESIFQDSAYGLESGPAWRVGGNPGGTHARSLSGNGNRHARGVFRGDRRGGDG